MDSHKLRVNHSKAKAVTWDEYRRGGGGDPSPHSRGPGPVGRLVRSWALRLISEEKNRFERAAVKTMEEFVLLRSRTGVLTRLFNVIKYDPALSGTVTAVKTILHFHFGCRCPAA